MNEAIREIRKNNKEWRAWESKDKIRTKISNHQYQSRNFDNTDSRSPKCGEGPGRCRRCRLYNDADDRRPRPAELMAESNPAESSGRIGSEGDWLKRSRKVGDC